jgi:hypothetical protein
VVFFVTIHPLSAAMIFCDTGVSLHYNVLEAVKVVIWPKMK